MPEFASRTSITERVELTVAGLLLLAVLILTFRRPEQPPAALMPSVGVTVDSQLRAVLPSGGAVRIVSDYCEVCRERSAAYLKAIGQSPNDLLLIEYDSINSHFEKLTENAESGTDRIIFMSRQDLASRVGVRFFPSYVEVDSSGIVRSWGKWDAGRFQSVFNPKHWLAAWQKLELGSTDTSGSGAGT